MKGRNGFRKMNIFLLILVILIAIAVGYYIAAGAAPGVTFFDWYMNMEKVKEDPFQWYYNDYTLPCIGMTLLITFFCVVYYICSGKTYRFGEEQGSSVLGDVNKENKLLSDPNTKKDDPENIVVIKKGLFGQKEYIINTRERVISENLHMSLNTKHTDLNNNVFIIGGSGAGKTFRWVKPNIMAMTGSYIITDPKGEILRSSAGFLKKHGYAIKVINLLNPKQMKKSSRYNPFRYIASDDDIIKLVEMYMEATKEENSQGGEQYWTDMAGLLLETLFYYVHYEGVEIKGVLHKDWTAVMHLANMVKVEETPQGMRKKTELDKIIDELAKRSPEHKAVLNYAKVMDGAADTVRSIISTFHSRLKRMQNDAILELLSEDEIDMRKIGVRKTAVFCVIPDNDKTYNFVISQFYDQLFKQMYDQADNVYGGALPVPVTFLLDEFANVALPKNFLSLLSTMRSRNISSVIIIQNLAQIKKMYKEEEWESIPGNCDVTVYLGGNEASTHKWVSEMMGKQTIDKRSLSESKGKQGSVSNSHDVMQRDLMYADEVRKLSRKKCIVLINGKDPLVDYKIKTLKHPLWKEYVRESKAYTFDGRLERIGGGEFTVKRVVDGVEEETRIRMYDPVDVNLLSEEDKRNQEEYGEECNIAKLTGSQAPEKPRTHVVNLTIGELMWLAEHEDELEGTAEQMLNGMEVNLTEEELIKLTEAIAADESNRHYDDVIDPASEFESPEEEDPASEDHFTSQVNGKAMVMAQAFGKLSRAGYTPEQIDVLLPLIEPPYRYTPELIQELFSPAYTLSVIQMMISMLEKQKEG